MAARAAQPDTVPSVEDFAVRGREEQDARDRTAIGSEAWLIPVQDPAAANDPGGMLTAAAQWPSARDAIAARDATASPTGRKDSGRSYMRVAAVDFARSFLPADIRPTRHTRRRSPYTSPRHHRPARLLRRPERASSDRPPRPPESAESTDEIAQPAPSPRPTASGSRRDRSLSSADARICGASERRQR